MAWGGLIGRGFGEGDPGRISYAESDFIVGAIGEELGLTGVLAVLLLYGLIVERALRVALIARDGFGKLMATGLAGRARAPGLRRGRRRDPADPADRPDHSVPLLRRLVVDRQLGDRRAAADGSPTRPAARCRTSPRPTTTPTQQQTQVVKAVIG